MLRTPFGIWTLLIHFSPASSGAGFSKDNVNMKQINLSNQDYASILMLMEKASRLISRDYTTPSERNIARRMNILRRKLEKK